MKSDRRDFMKTAAAGAAPMFVPRSAWGANARPNYALIGAGGRGRYLNRIFQQDGPKCIAVGEVYEPNMQEAMEGVSITRTLLAPETASSRTCSFSVTAELTVPLRHSTRSRP